MWKRLKRGEKSIRIAFRLAESDWRALQGLTDDENTPSDIIRSAVLDFIRKHAKGVQGVDGRA